MVLNFVRFGSWVHKTIHRKMFDAAWINAAFAKGIDECEPVIAAIIFHQVRVGSDDAAQEIAKGDVYRRAIIERAYAHIQYVLGRFAGFGGQPVYQIRIQFTLRQNSGALGSYAQQVGDTAFINGKKGLEYG